MKSYAWSTFIAHGMHTSILRHCIIMLEFFSLQIEVALEYLNGVGEVTVSYSTTPLPHDVLGKFCPGRSYTVLFETVSGDLPSIVVNDGDLTGDDTTTTVTEVNVLALSNPFVLRECSRKQLCHV